MATVTVSDRIQLLLKLGSRRANPALRYDVASVDPDVQAIIATFDEILLREAETPTDKAYRLDEAKRISKHLKSAPAWEVVHQSFAQPFLQDTLESAMVLRLRNTLSQNIGVDLIRGLRDSRFTGNRRLAEFYCEQVLYAAKRWPSPPMDEVIRMLEVLNGERKLFGPMSGVPWEATLQRLAKTYVVQLPIPADAPKLAEAELPIPAEEVPVSAQDLPTPSESVSTPKRGFWRRLGNRNKP